MPDTQPKSTRGARRRELILRSAAELMAERGYPSVSMTQIGAASGIVGSGVYRHFDSKATLLGALLGRVVTAMLDGTREIVASAPTGRALIDALVRRQTAIVIENRALVAVYLRDAGNLPADDLHELRRRQRQLIEEWMDACRSLVPEASDAELRTAVQAVLALINSLCTYVNPLPVERLGQEIAEMAIAAFAVGIGLADD